MTISKKARVSSSGVDPERWVDDHGDCLYRYALLRVRRPEVAEDLVQETLCSAVRTFGSFQQKSSERSRLCGILKNKICDYFRRLGRETCFTEEMETVQICQALRISHNNLWVMLHRARMALRECLELNWFKNRPKLV